MNKIRNKFLISTLLFPILYFLNLTVANSHQDLKILHPAHPPIICKPQSERTFDEKFICKDKLRRHKLCTLDAQCAILELEKLRDEVTSLQNKIKNQDPINCDSLTFAHVALDTASMFKDTSGNSKVISKVKKGQKISFVGPTDKEGWIIVVPKAKVCNIGYINESYIGLATKVSTAKKEAPKIKSNIKITYPKWKKVNELIVLDSSGFFEIDGFVNKDQGINKVIVNYDGSDEEMILGSDGSFNGSLQIENSLDVRITTYKNEKQIGKALVFKVEVE